jgi:2-(1,2-epoxy-1,2-dihydrophenyl)acetyl-CoA isomerase
MSDADGTVDQDLLWEVGDDGVAWLTLNRPDAANAITPDQRNRTIELLDGASTDLNVRTVVITAAGERHFCTGADLRVSKIPVNPGPHDAPEKALGDVGRNIKRGAQRLISSILDCEKPVICAVNGTAAGIGAHIAFASDLVIAADNAKFIEVFVRRGITPDGGGAYLLPRIVGLQKAKEMIFFGDDVRADEAHRIGLVNKVVPQAELRVATEEWAAKLAASPTKAVGLSKWLLNRSLDSSRGQAFEDEAWAQEMASYTQDFQEGVAAFKERRDVRYRGW